MKLYFYKLCFPSSERRNGELEVLAHYFCQVQKVADLPKSLPSSTRPGFTTTSQNAFWHSININDSSGAKGFDRAKPTRPGP